MNYAGKEFFEEQLDSNIIMHTPHVLTKGVVTKNTKLVCERCGNMLQHLFGNNDFGIYCRNCLKQGKSTDYTNLIRFRTKTSDLNQHARLKRELTLSAQQQQASDHCLAAYKKKGELLVWAVCGAGKTEIVYALLLKAMHNLQTICFATPRKDIVIELSNRFKRDFENLNIIALYGGSPDLGKAAPFVVATTHQLINYYDHFDVMIIDEIDAFPYYFDQSLQYAVKKSCKQRATTILLTATPRDDHKKRLFKKQLDYVLIPARFHQHPIPVPKLRLIVDLSKKINKGMLTKSIIKWLKKSLEAKRQVMLFVPSISDGEQLLKKLKPIVNVHFTHAMSEQRNDTIKLFREQKTNVLITTTILERGVTFSKINVAIINCENKIFDESAIVQIIGRAGRDARYPTADVTLFAEYKTKAITDAIKQINYMNKLANQQRE